MQPHSVTHSPEHATVHQQYVICLRSLFASLLPVSIILISCLLSLQILRLFFQHAAHSQIPYAIQESISL